MKLRRGCMGIRLLGRHPNYIRSACGVHSASLVGHALACQASEARPTPVVYRRCRRPVGGARPADFLGNHGADGTHVDNRAIGLHTLLSMLAVNLSDLELCVGPDKIVML